MWIPILAVSTALAGGLFVITVFFFARRAQQLEAQARELAELRKQAEQFEARHQERCKQADELRARLDKTRDEAKKAKKKAYDQERSARTQPAESIEALERAHEEVLLEAKAETKRWREQVEQAEAEAERARAAADKCKAEALVHKQRLEDHQDSQVQTRQTEAAQIQKLQAALDKLTAKLETANRRLKNDAQVYRVTNSKLELALEKIGMYEKLLAEAKKG